MAGDLRSRSGCGESLAAGSLTRRRVLVMGIVDGKMSLRLALVPRGRVWDRAAWQGDDEVRALSFRAPDDDLSLMKFHELAYDRETEPAAAMFAGSGPVGTVKGFEDAQKIILCDTDTVVRDAQPYVSAVVRRDLDADLASGSCIDEGILDEVVGDLFERRGISPHEEEFSLVHGEAYVFLLGESGEFLDRGQGDRPEVDIAERDAFRIEQGVEGQEVVDDIRCPVELIDVVGERAADRRMKPVLEERDLDVRLHDRERGAEFVRDVSDEFLLRCEGVARGSESDRRDEESEAGRGRDERRHGEEEFTGIDRRQRLCHGVGEGVRRPGVVRMGYDRESGKDGYDEEELEHHDVRLRPEEEIVAVPIREVGSPPLAPSQECSERFLDRFFYGDF